MNREQWIKEGEDLVAVRARQIAEADEITEQEQRLHDIEIARSNESMCRYRQHLAGIGRSILRNSPSLFVSFDAEMDGGSLLAFGAVTPWGESIKREVKPATDFFVPSQRDFCETHGLTRERLMDEGMPLDEAIYDLDMWVRRAAQKHNKNPVFMAFNASEDWPLISNPMKRMGIKNPFGNAGYCLKSEAQSLAMIAQFEHIQPGTLLPGERWVADNAKQASCNWKDTAKAQLPAWIVPEREFTHDPLEDSDYQLEIKYALTGYIAKVAVRNAHYLNEDELTRRLREPDDPRFSSGIYDT